MIFIAAFFMYWNEKEAEIQPAPEEAHTQTTRPDIRFDQEETEEVSGRIEYDKEDLVYEGDAPVYVTIYAHNEDSWEYIVNTEEKYRSYREGLIERAEVLAEYGVEWNWQTDQPVVEAMIEYEYNPEFREREDVSEIGGANILEHLATLGVHFDPHAHNNNYADIAYLMEERLHVEVTGVIGGTIFVECGTEHLGFQDFVSWHNEIGLQSDGYIYGKDYPNAKWKPTVLSDPGMGGHYFDDLSSGVWKPGEINDFYWHYPENDIVYIGEGYPHDVTIIGENHSSGATVVAENGQYIKELVALIQNKEVPTGTIDGKQFMYTASVHMRDNAIVREGGGEIDTAAGLATFMDELERYRDRGEVIFVDFEEAARIWEEEYDEVPWSIDATKFSFYEELESEASTFCEERLATEAERPERPNR